MRKIILILLIAASQCRPVSASATLDDNFLRDFASKIDSSCVEYQDNGAIKLSPDTIVSTIGCVVFGLASFAGAAKGLLSEQPVAAGILSVVGVCLLIYATCERGSTIIMNQEGIRINEKFIRWVDIKNLSQTKVVNADSFGTMIRHITSTDIGVLERTIYFLGLYNQELGNINLREDFLPINWKQLMQLLQHFLPDFVVRSF